MKALISVVLLAAAVALSAPAAALAAPHENQRTTVEGKIRSMHHERDGWRVELDRGGYSFWVPERTLHGRPGDFRVGVSVRFGGVFRGGVIIVDAVDWPYRDHRPRYETAFVRGVIERIDYQRDLLVVRERRSGRRIRADMSTCDRGWGNAYERHELYPGDVVELSGADWDHDGIFEVARIENVRVRR